MVALLVIDVQLALVVFATLPVADRRHVLLPPHERQGVRAGPRAGQRRQRRPPGVRRRAADRAGVPPRARRRRPLRRAQRQLPPGPRPRPVADLGLLPVRAAAVLGRRGGRADRRRGPGRGGHAHHRRAGRLPALHRPVLRPRPAALPGLRRLPAGHRLARPHPGAAAEPTSTAAAERAAATCRRCAARSPSRTCDFAYGRRARRKAGPERRRACASRPGRPSPSSARPARASRRWSSWSPGSTTRPAAGSPPTAPTCGTST